MAFIRLCGVALLVSAVSVTRSDAIDSNGKILACYYQPSSRVPVSKIPVDLCTHIIFAFGNMAPSGIVPSRSSDVKTYSALIAMKKRNPNLKVLISLQQGFPSVVDAGTSVMNTFTKSAIVFLRKYGFDGIDFDWEFPKSNEKNNYMKFLSIFRGAVSKEAVRFNSSNELSPLLMSMALSNNANTANKAYDIAAVNRNVDFATIMSYDFHVYSKGDSVTGFNSALYAPKGEPQILSVSGIIGKYVSSGLSPSKALMGMATYGRTYTLADPSKHGLHAPASGRGAGGPVIHAPGVYITQEVCMVNKTATGRARDPTAMAPYLYKGNTWLSYDDPQSYDLKCKWALNKNLGGMGVWALALDDISGSCPGGPFPLISILSRCLK